MVKLKRVISILLLSACSENKVEEQSITLDRDSYSLTVNSGFKSVNDTDFDLLLINKEEEKIIIVSADSTPDMTLQQYVFRGEMNVLRAGGTVTSKISVKLNGRSFYRLQFTKNYKTVIQYVAYHNNKVFTVSCGGANNVLEPVEEYCDDMILSLKLKD